MRKNLLFIVIISFLGSCSTSETSSSFNYEGVWKRIGHIKYENGVATDTLIFPEGSIRRSGIFTPGFRYKIYGSGHSIWFDSSKKVDKDKKILEEYNDMFAKTTYKIQNDSIFETFNFFHSKGFKIIFHILIPIF